MDNNDFSNLGRQIQDMVQYAMDSMNFSQLNRMMNETVTQALHEARMHKEKVRGQFEQQSYQQTNQQTYEKPDYGRPMSKKQKARSVLSPSLKKGTGKIVFGAVMLSFPIMVWLTILLFLSDTLTGEGVIGVLGNVLVASIVSVLPLWLLIWGLVQRRRYRMARQYVDILDGRGFCGIRELAEATGETEDRVRKNLKKLIQKKAFREAYLDRQETCLMVDRESYDYYIKAEYARREREAAEAKKKQEEETFSPEIAEMIRVGEQYIRTIREANDDIPGEQISEKLDRLELVVHRIFESVKKHPEQKKEMDKFMDYYMPTTLKLVNTYREFDAMEVKGINIQSAMNEIENTLDTITAAFEKLLDDLFQDTAFDVAADISVLQTMLAREGYKEKDFK